MNVINSHSVAVRGNFMISDEMFLFIQRLKSKRNLFVLHYFEISFPKFYKILKALNVNILHGNMILC